MVKNKKSHRTVLSGSVLSGPAKTVPSGFTIVELLIVIIVIGVLAALVLIGYTNVQALATDTSIKTDLRNMYDKLDYYKGVNGTYPKDNAAELGSRGMKINKNSYDTTNAFNIAYCYNFSTDDYVIASRSKTGNEFAIGSDVPLKSLSKTATNDGLSASSDCSDIGAGYYRLYAGYDKNNAYNGYVPGDTVPWRQWVTSPAVIDAKTAQ